MIEQWPASTKDHYIYTDDEETAQQLQHDIGGGATYSKGGNVIGWQFITPNRLLNMLKKRLPIVLN